MIRLALTIPVFISSLYYLLRVSQIIELSHMYFIELCTINYHSEVPLVGYQESMNIIKTYKCFCNDITPSKYYLADFT